MFIILGNDLEDDSDDMYDSDEYSDDYSDDLYDDETADIQNSKPPNQSHSEPVKKYVAPARKLYKQPSKSQFLSATLTGTILFAYMMHN